MMKEHNNKETFHFRRQLDYQTDMTERMYEKENRFWHHNTMMHQQRWWYQQSASAKFFAGHDYIWNKGISKYGLKDTMQKSNHIGGRNRLTSLGGFFYIYGTLKMSVRNLYLHTLSLVRYYEAADRLSYRLYREMSQPGFRSNHQIMRTAMVDELEGFARHLQSVLAFGEGYLDIWNEFGKCYVEFAKTADGLADMWISEGFMQNDIDKRESLVIHNWEFQSPVNYDANNLSDGGKRSNTERVYMYAIQNYFGGRRSNEHKGNAGLYSLMPQAFDYGQSFTCTAGDWYNSGYAKWGPSKRNVQMSGYGFVLKFLFGPLGNKEKFLSLFSDFYFMENYNRGMTRRCFRMTEYLGELASEVYSYQQKGGLDPALFEYTRQLITYTVVAERRMFRSRTEDERHTGIHSLFEEPAEKKYV